ncbi:haemagglutinin-like protein [Rhodopseudomonas palustris HaA2]|uniref:Haemagglutinin-like protein n=1 Tax=Rhodopseudomonas palustris (strain HaA2) TaxID=316058 RepID=Q2J2W7_RHOP2|nr:filamentous haemagglutinin family protein [Rhodopseudomonas palustris]ABD05193.1 haemagglutinin-like protein [Rhodopseudomonas palustris HaA2]
MSPALHHDVGRRHSRVTAEDGGQLRVTAKRRALSRRLMLTSTSALALTVLLTAAPAMARSLGGAAPDYSAAAVAAAAATAAAQQGSAAAQRSVESLTQAAQALQGIQAAQAAARAAAQAAGVSVTAPVVVPNGLAAGGLVPDSGLAAPGAARPVLSWTNARTPVQSGPADAPTVTVQQTGAQAILNWASFNVGASTSVVFDQQGNSNWVALNRVVGAASPSQILGSIGADGSVYIINQNGIIFGGASQVNVGSLIASAAQVTDAQFKANGIYSSLSGSSYLPSFSGATGAITVEQGALINTSAPGAVTQGGGFVMLLGTSVSNAGTITTPKGQTVLAAGRDFVVRKGYATDANSFSTTRGNEIAPGLWNASSSSWTPGGGAVTNSGLVFAQQGDITLAGHAVAQNGVAIATTSVDIRGSIHLLNAASDASGSVTLGAASLTQIMPELGSADTALNSKRDALIADSATQNAARATASFGQFGNLSSLADRQDLGRVEIVSGGVVTFDGGSLTLAQGGQIAVSARARVFAAGDAVLDVSGTSSVLPMSANSLKINVQPNEMRDAPVNRESGVLTNQDVWIDARDLVLVPAGTGGYASDRYYTKGGLLEVSGYLANTGHSVGEWTAVGGIITLSAAELVAQAGSVFNLSGGTISYQAGQVLTSNVMGADGRLYPIGSVPADMPIIALGRSFTVDHSRWGVKDVWGSPSHGATTSRWDDGYTVGRDAGQLVLSAPTSVFEGSIVAEVITGLRQTAARPTGVSDGYKLTQTTVPLAGALMLGQYGAIGRTGAVASEVIIGDVADITSGLGAEAALPSGRANTAWFDAGALNEAGLGGLSIASSNSIRVSSDLTLARGGILELVAPTIDVAATLTARGGAVTLSTLLSRVYPNGDSIGRGTLPLTPALGRASITLEENAVIDTRGLWTNALLDPAGDASGQAFADGGAVTLRSSGDVTLGTGSIIDASAGAALLAGGKLKGGNGGNISLIASESLTDVNGTTSGNTIHGDLTLRGTLISYGFGKGGKLTLQTGGSVSIGGTSASLNLSPELFGSGFSAYSINGLTRLMVADGVAITATMPVLRADPNRAFSAPSGGAATAVASLWTPPLYLENPAKGTLAQRAGASVALLSGAGADSSGYITTEGALSIGTGASITVDPGQSVRLAASGQVTVDGTITAPGGSIAITNNYTQLHYVDPAAMSVWIGEHAVLDVAARAYIAADVAGRRYGVIPDGGAITLGSTGGAFKVMGSSTNEVYEPGNEASTHAYVVIRPGAVLDASGTSGELDIATGGSLRSAFAPVTVASDGGTIALRSWSGIHAEGTMQAFAGGAGAAGGTLIVSLEAPIQTAVASIVVPTNLKVGRVLTVTQDIAGTLAAGLQPGQSDATLALGQGTIAVSQIAAGGFDDVSLLGRGAILFDGDVSLEAGRSLSLEAGQYADLGGGRAVVSAPYVRFGGQDVFIFDYNTVPSTVPAYAAVGTLAVDGDLIELGGNVATTFATTSFTSHGDLRFVTSASVPNPGLYAAHDLTLSAVRIYPESGTMATVAAGYTKSSYSPGSSQSWMFTDPAAVLTLVRPDAGAAVEAPYSAFGELSLTAGTIRHGGALFAPFGGITLTATRVGSNVVNTAPAVVEFLPGSITSVSGAGLVMPYGGTTDGVGWTVNGTDGATVHLITGQYMKADGTVITLGARRSTGISIRATTIVGDAGATLDLSGGGALTGAAFISGRGGSVDTLLASLTKGGTVYAIVPGVVTTPVAGNYYSAWTGAVPAVGQTITIPAGVPGLPAGTYTLLPANYALLPGAFRVELGGTGTTAFAGTIGLTNGSWLTSGYQGIAHTAIRDVLPTSVTITPAATVRTYSQYNETSYDAFQIAQADTFDMVRPRLEADAGNLTFLFSALNASGAAAAVPALVWDGTTDLTPAAGGYGGTVSVMVGGSQDLIIAADGSTTERSATKTVLSASAINALNAPHLFIGGKPMISSNISIIGGDPFTQNNSANAITLESGVVLTGGQIVMNVRQGGTIRLDPGAMIDTRGFADVALLDSSLGYYLGGGVPMLVASNGAVALYTNNAANATGTISIGAGAGIFTRNAIGFVSAMGVSFDGTPLLGAENLELVAASINLGTAANLAAARAAGTLPVGFDLTQELFASLVAGDPSRNITGVRKLGLGTGNSVNIYGSVNLDLSALDSLTLTTAAIYGAGGGNDSAVLKAGSLNWNVGQRTVSTDGNGTPNYGSALPGAVTANGPGTGRGSLTIQARDITLGHADMLGGGSTVTFDRLILGFQDVTLSASNSITSEDHNTLSFWRTGASPTSTFDAKTYTGEVGHRLSLITPLLTGESGSVLSVYSGSSIFVTAPEGSTPVDTSTVSSLGATINLHSIYNGVVLDTAVALPSGRFTATGGGMNVELRNRAHLDLSGRAVSFGDVTRYSWGGDIGLEASTSGAVIFFQGAVLDVSAVNNDAGSISIAAPESYGGGFVVFVDGQGRTLSSLDGMFKGAATGGYEGGSFKLETYHLDSGPGWSNTTSFARLNRALNASGFFGSREFNLKDGNLTIGDELKAHHVVVSVDDGSLTVNGHIDASGATPGTIRLAASDNLTIASSAVLDVHGTELQVDSYGQPIEAKNRGHIELTSSDGTLSLGAGSVMDLSTPSGAYGQVVLNARRTSETSGDIRISAAGSLAIRGASSIALNAFWRYGNYASNTVVTQAMLDTFDIASQSFIKAAYDNDLATGQLTAGLKGKLAGLTAHGSAFHLRPGVEISSGGDLATSGDLDLAKYRYGPNADRYTTSASFGAGEPGALVIRAGGNLTIGGSISDGFGTPVSVYLGEAAGAQETLNATKTLTAATGISTASIPIASLPTTLNFDAVLNTSNSLRRGIAIPFAFTSAANVAQTGWTATANIYNASGTLLYATGSMVTTTLPSGTQFAAGSTLPGSGALRIQAGAVIPANTVIKTYISQTTSLFLGSQTLPLGATLPSGTAINYATTPMYGQTSRMLAAGSQSWSIRLVAGSDLSAASTLVLRAASGLAGSGNIVLNNAGAVDFRGIPIPSVIRTGTGDLELLAGGDLTMRSLYGVYTAGTDAGATGLPAGTYMPDHGGDLTVTAQGDVTGYSYNCTYSSCGNAKSWSPAIWLIRSGDSTTNAAWSIAFDRTISGSSASYITGFAGFGTLGGGDVTLTAGGDAGAMTRTYTGSGVTAQTYGALQVAVAASGKVLSVTKDGAIVTGGTLVQAGGGDLVVKVGGSLNTGYNYSNSEQAADGSLSIFTNLRGDTTITAGAIGAIGEIYGFKETGDPRGLDANEANLASARGGIALIPGDGTITVRTAGDLVIGSYADAGQLGGTASSTSFSLWQPQTTAISLFSAGGNLVPVTNMGIGNPWSMKTLSTSVVMAPGLFDAVAADGSIYLGGNYAFTFELAPSPNGRLNLLAGQSIYGAGLWVGGLVNVTAAGSSTRIVVSSAASGVNDIPNPFRPSTATGSFFSFQDDRVSASTTDDTTPNRIVALTGDIINLALGETLTDVYYDNAYHVISHGTGKSAQVIAGGDIVNFGAGSAGATAGLILNTRPTDVSVIRAGGSIFYLNMNIAGPGALDISAVDTIYQGNLGAITSIGPLASGDTRPGASIVVAAGLGSDGADYAALTKYLDAANLAATGIPLADQSGKVARSYDAELIAWLFDYYGYRAQNAADARAVFAAKPAEQQNIFLRSVYFAELKAGGREYNDPSSSRYGSYLRGRRAIAALFPEDRSYAGDLIMFGGSGIRTLYGGDIAILTPGGRQVLGVEGTVPPASSGVITQGAGDIGLYSKGSILIGLSRIMTTFGGGILGWSAEGDINAGRGSKTTQVYTPPKRIYDSYGNVTLSPAAPATGAGIATLNPVPGTPAGDVDLIAPLGTIDAGEAGIRVAGNANLAARQILNAANIQVQGASSGLPTVQAPPTAALTAANNVAGAATPTAAGPAQDNDRPSIILVEFLGFGGGDGGDTKPRSPDRDDRRRTEQQGYNFNSAFQIIQLGDLAGPARSNSR